MDGKGSLPIGRPENVCEVRWNVCDTAHFDVPVDEDHVDGACGVVALFVEVGRMDRGRHVARFAYPYLVTAIPKTSVHVQSRFGGRSNLGGFAWAWHPVVLSHVHVHAVRGHIEGGPWL